jgi:hypothetical protein
MDAATRKLWALKLAVESMPAAGHPGTTQIFLDRAKSFDEWLIVAPGSGADAVEPPSLGDRPARRRRG